ncbi:MAG: hypothetical protein ACK2U4_18135, partial [Candidatus Promineifilaceae bacterium]
GFFIMSILALTTVSARANILIMKTPKYDLRALKHFFDRHKVVTLDQLRQAMGNPARCTVFRKLGDLQYLSSYSHRGKYYTLNSIARFSEQGLWSFGSVWFSRFGNLLQTAEAFVHGSDAGYSAAELKDILQVKTKHALTQLVREARLSRESFEAVYVYLSVQKDVARRQIKARKAFLQQSPASLIVANPDLATDEARALLVLFCSMLNEQQRRLYAGLESLKLGHGGDAHIASILGMDPHTVAKGRKELMGADLTATGRLRAPGAGRPSQEKKHRRS